MIIYSVLLSCMTLSSIQPRTEALAPMVDVHETIMIDGKEYDMDIATFREHEPKHGLMVFLIFAVLGGTAFWAYILSLLIGWKMVINVAIGFLVILLLSHMYYVFRGKK